MRKAGIRERGFASLRETGTRECGFRPRKPLARKHP